MRSIAHVSAAAPARRPPAHARTRPRLLGRRPRAAALVTAGALVATGAVLSAPAAHAEPECLSPSYDLDGDRTPDTVVGAPGTGARIGVVEVRLSTGRTQLLTGPQGFGASVTQLGSYAQEGDDAWCTQLVVGSPNETVAGRARAGAVYLYAYDPATGGLALRARYTADSPGVPGASQAGARFGAAVVSRAHTDEEIDPAPRFLWVGSPGQDVAGVRDAGLLTAFKVGPGGPTAYAGRTITLATPGVPGSPTVGGKLGSSLAQSGPVLAAGAPGQRDAGAASAGAALVVVEPTTGTWPAPMLLEQSTPGVPGVPEAGDRLGAAVALVETVPGRVRLVIGAPGEDVGSVSDAGTVVVGPVAADPGGAVGPFTLWSQDSAGTGSSVERGDAFGAAVSSAVVGGRWRVLVGAPGEDVGSVVDAGSVQTLGTGHLWTENSPGVPGSAETGDRMGATLGAFPAAREGQVPAIGVPGEDAATGAVLTGLPVTGAPTVHEILGRATGARYGYAVAP
jgi:hypothetical protein